ncbi:CapA family protein [Pseudoalteromonas sp. MB47]|uniref:CapA family protein n=1 Tax=Pseudoalteromonas sp. MB47 TaxID=2588452 RepID=UPI0014082CF1|nr:CapA family protein [Pseudoalteromonas sp. MB47]NHH89279.1 Capsule biosynthesis protein CapA [Pseudoalteromonas sp. MB47]
MLDVDMKLLITGDLAITRKYNVTENLDKAIVELFQGSDFNIVNLEAPITSSTSKIIKTGPHLKAEQESTLELIKRLNINVAALANNHIKDYNERGVLDTLDFCKRNNVLPVGAGADLSEASRTRVICNNKVNVALVNIAENEWASAEEDSAGANGMDFIKDLKRIRQAKQDYDHVIVIVHGGHEFYSLPSPRMKEQYRFYAECGADLVVGHHTHCVSGYEIYQSVPIYYSLGNFLFTEKSKNNDWYDGLILEVEFINGKLKTNIHHVMQEKSNYKLILPNNGVNKVLEKVEELSTVITDNALLNRCWDDYVQTRSKAYLNYWSPKVFIKNKLLSILLNKLKINFSNIKGLSYYYNLIRCEAHCDLSKAVIKGKLKK